MAKCILIVDDEPVNILLIKRKLIENGYEVITANDGVEAFEVLQKKIPDLILLDVQMPRMNGYSFLMQRSKTPVFASIPVIGLSANPNIGPLFKRYGVKAYLVKPVDINMLLEKVKTFAC